MALQSALFVTSRMTILVKQNILLMYVYKGMFTKGLTSINESYYSPSLSKVIYGSSFHYSVSTSKVHNTIINDLQTAVSSAASRNTMSDSTLLFVQKMSLTAAFISTKLETSHVSSLHLPSPLSAKTESHLQSSTLHSSAIHLSITSSMHSSVLTFPTQTPSLKNSLSILSEIRDSARTSPALKSPTSVLSTWKIRTPLVVETSSCISYDAYSTNCGMQPTSSINPACSASSGCSQKKEDKSFLFIVLGVSAGAAVVFFVFLMVFAVIKHKRKARKPSRNYRGGGLFLPEKASDELMASKESMFNSSTLQLDRGHFNDGLEMDGNFSFN